MTTYLPLLDRLEAMRRAVRRRLIAYGVLAVGAGGVAAFLTIVSFDQFLDFPSVLRIIVALIFFGGFAFACNRWIITPLRSPLTVETIASRLERHFPGLDDRLTSTVQFLQGGAIGSERMRSAVIDETEKQVAALPLESALSLRRIGHSAASCALAAVVLLVVGLAAPQWVRTGVVRYTDPFGDTQWPRTVEIEPLTHDVAVAVGESALVRMRITKGLSNELRGVVRLREKDGTVSALTMQRRNDGTFEAAIDSITADLEYWFEAGDDDTARHPRTIRAVKRPTVVEALAEVIPPPYAAQRAARTHDLAEGAVKVPVGGRAVLRIRSSKPVAADGALLRVITADENEKPIPLQIDSSDATLLSVALPIAEDKRFTVELRDQDGFENHGALEYSLVARADTPPTVAILEPQAVAEVTPDATLPVLVRVEDDFGVSGLRLDVERLGASRPRSVDLMELLSFSDEAGRVIGEARYEWELGALALSPGDTVLYSALARDNCDICVVEENSSAAEDVVGQHGRSATMRLRVVSEIEMQARMREDVGILETRIREALIEQNDLLDRTLGLVDSETSEQPRRREEIEGGASSQARLARRMREVARRFDELMDRASRNRLKDAEGIGRLEDAGRLLREVSEGPMSSAATTMTQAAEQREAQDQQSSLETAAAEQERAVDQMRELLRDMGQWGHFKALANRTRDLIDRQESLREQTGQTGQPMAGKPVEALTDEEKAALARLRRRQEQIAADADQLIERMERLAEQEREEDPAAAEASHAAARAARANDLGRHLEESAKAIDENRTASAMLGQREALQALKKMASALEEREKRELERLRKELREADEIIARLLKDEEEIKADTESAEADPGGADPNDLRRRQRTLRRNARLTGDDLLEKEGAVDAGRLVRRSARPMGEAESALHKGQMADALTAQDDAIALLIQAREALAAAQQRADEEALARTLREVHESLVEIQRAQVAINREASALQANVDAKGRIGRAEARTAASLSRAQGEARGQVDALLPDLESVIVFQWSLQRVSGWMEEAQAMLDKRTIDDALRDSHDRIAAELDRLIGAISRTREMPLDVEFAEAEEGGGGGQSGMPGAVKPVPTMAELLVLKGMQAEINERTAGFGEASETGEVTEEVLRDLKRIGEDQEQVRELAERLTARAQEP